MKKLIILGVSVILFGCTKTPVMESSKESVHETQIETSLSSSEAESSSDIETKEVATEEQTKESNQDRIGAMVTDLSKVNLNTYSDIPELKLSDEASAEFILSTDYSLKDFKIQSISYDGVDLTIEDTLFEMAALTPETGVKISAYIPPMFSDLLVSYVDQNGKTVYYFIDSNMEGTGGSVTLTDASEIVK